MKKKILLVVACLTLALVLVTACGGTDDPTTETPATSTATTDTSAAPAATTPADTDEPATTVSIWFMGGNAQNDDAAVVEAANARLRELGLNIEVRPIWTGGWGMGEPAQLALDTGDTSVDILWTATWGLNYFNNARVGNFIRLDDPSNNLLERYGQDMMAAVPSYLWDAFRTEGPAGFGLYGVPGPKDYAALFTLDVNNTRLAELGFDFDDIFDMNGTNYDFIFDPRLDEILAASQEMWGDNFFPLNLEAGNFVQHFSNVDGDLTGLNLFHFGFDPNNPALPIDPVVGLNIEDERFLRVLDRVRHFWEMGYIDPRLAIPTEAGIVIGEASQAGEYLFSTGQYAYGHTAAMQASRGIDSRFVPISRPIISTMSAAGSGFGVSVYSRNQAAAVQFLNAWYTDNQLAVILSEGVEGIHWNYNDEGLIVLDDDARATYGTWRFGMGNIFILTPRETDGHGYFDRFRAYNAAGTPTSTMGFIFNNEAVAMEMAALTGVVEQWRQSVTVGALDPATAVPAWHADLVANGVERVREELNRQLQEFYAAR